MNHMPKQPKGTPCPKPDRHHVEMEMIVLTDIYDRYAALSFEEATSHFEGLAALIEHHPRFRPEAAALRRMKDAELVLNNLRSRTYSI